MDSPHAGTEARWQPGLERPGRAPAEALESALLDDVQRLLDRWRVQFAGRPETERTHLRLLALEREQIVAVAYREEAVAGRVASLEVRTDVRALIHQMLIWIWKDEQLHAEYLRGRLLRTGGAGSRAVVYGRQLQGALSGWVSATSNHRDARTAPLRAGAAGLLVAVAAATGQIPSFLRTELRYLTFRRYCELNVALEASAELAYRRLIEVTRDADERHTLEQICEDEQRHAAGFRLIAGELTDDDRLIDPAAAPALIERLGAVSPWFVPADLRASVGPKRHHFLSQRPVVVGTGDSGEKLAVLGDCLNRSGLADLVPAGGSAAIRTSFMLGYDRRDRSNVTDPALVDAVALYLRDCGASEVSVLEAPTIYQTSFGHRSVPEVARYFGFDSPNYRVVDIGRNQRPCSYERGFVQHSVSATWMDADLRIVMPKLRTAPTDFAHLSLCTLEGTNGAIGDTVYAGRELDYRSATMMLLDVAPPDFSIVDAWDPVADGVFGVMGCSHPARVRALYAGVDALAVDEVVLGDLGLADPRRGADRPPGPPLVRVAPIGRGGRRRSPGPPQDAARRPFLPAPEGSRPARGPGLRLPQPQGRGLCARLRHRRLPAAPTRRTGAPAGPSGDPGHLRPSGTSGTVSVRRRAGGHGLRARGVANLARQGGIASRLLAVADSRSLVRTLFLSSAARSELLPFLQTERSLGELVERTGAVRTERLESWLDVGVELGELRRRGDRYRVRGSRARALAGGDALLRSHYRSVLDYQAGPYQDLARHLVEEVGQGRHDLVEYAREISQVSMAAVPFVEALLRRTVAELRPRRVLDVGCGGGVYTTVVLTADQAARVEAVDLSEDVVGAARREIAAAGLAGRARFHVGDVRTLRFPPDRRFDLVMLLNSVYYVEPSGRVELYRGLRQLLSDGGQLLVASMTRRGSVAAAHLDLMLQCQSDPAVLPDRGQLIADLGAAGFGVLEELAPVPTEPYLAVRARVDGAGRSSGHDGAVTDPGPGVVGPAGFP